MQVFIDEAHPREPIEQDETIGKVKLFKGKWTTAGDPLGNKLADLFPALNLPKHLAAEMYIWSFRSLHVHFYFAEQTEDEARKKYAEKARSEVTRKDIKESERRVLRDEVRKYGGQR